jgi:predicted amidohydrolase YtcJ
MRDERGRFVAVKQSKSLTVSKKKEKGVLINPTKYAQEQMNEVELQKMELLSTFLRKQFALMRELESEGILSDAIMEEFNDNFRRHAASMGELTDTVKRGLITEMERVIAALQTPAPQMIECAKCETESALGVKFCHACGNDLRINSADEVYEVARKVRRRESENLAMRNWYSIKYHITDWDRLYWTHKVWMHLEWPFERNAYCEREGIEIVG